LKILKRLLVTVAILFVAVDGKVIQIFAGLFREMDIYPTLGVSAGIVEEDLETSRRHEH
jgi:hypothetical protein